MNLVYFVLFPLFGGWAKKPYKNLLSQYGVVACFSGHHHRTLGSNGLFGSVPNFRSGSASQSTYLIVEQLVDRLDIYTVRENNWSNGNRVHSIALPSPILPGINKIVTTLNNSSVVQSTGLSNNNVFLGSYNQWNAQKWNFEYNQSKQAYIIRNGYNSNLVLAWNDEGGSRNVFATPFVQAYDEHYWIASPFPSQNGYVLANKKNPNLVLNVYNSDTSQGTNISVHPRHDSNTSARNQTFLIQRI
ncbi:RICIN domain-containing protein [Bacillus mycoides]|uniref:RICIN domain-containing protein n=1 Tax=Bacillus mycoides TaxID=1405 RepID=UPI003CFF2F84